MKILFIGTVDFSLKALQKLIELDANIVGVCTKEKSTFNSDFKNLIPICEENNIKTHQAKNINSKESIDWIKECNPDIIFCFGWSSLIKAELLAVPSLGIVGYHPAALPLNRGRHPLIWALALGLKKSASTFFFMKEGADDGDILSQKLFEITYNDDATSLYEKVIATALIQIEIFLPQLQSNNFRKIKQNHEQANLWRKRGQRDGEIDFRMSNRAIYNLVRALTKPYVGAHICYQESNISIWKVEEINFNQDNIEPGKVLEVKDNTFTIKCYEGAVKILEHEFKKLPAVGEYL